MWLVTLAVGRSKTLFYAIGENEAEAVQRIAERHNLDVKKLTARKI